MTSSSTNVGLSTTRWRWALPAVLALGVFLRLLGYFSRDLQLWLDEASWAIMMVKGTAAWIRPAGYMWLENAVVSVRNTEATLRLPSLVAGVLLLPVWWRAMSRAMLQQPAPVVEVVRATVLVGTFVLAVHPIAVSMSKEFKPYIIDALLHVVLVWCAVSYLHKPRRLALVALGVTAVVSPLFAWSLVFAYPGVFATTMWRAFRQRRFGDLAIAAGGAAATLVTLVLIWRARVAGENEKTSFWGRKYDVFYVAHPGDNSLAPIAWSVRKTWQLVVAPLDLDYLVPVPVAVFGGLCTLLALAALVQFVRLRLYNQLALWVLPWGMCLLFNAAGKWPWGMFRTNAFMLVYAAALLAWGAYAVTVWLAGLPIASSRGWRTAGAVVVGAMLVVALPWHLGNFAVKQERTLALSSSVRTAMDDIVREEGLHPSVRNALTHAKPILLLDGHACGIFEYYSEYHADSAPAFGSFFHDRFEVVCATVSARKWNKALTEHADSVAWILSAKPSFVALTHRLLALEPLASSCRPTIDRTLPVDNLLVRCAREPR